VGVTKNSAFVVDSSPDAGEDDLEELVIPKKRVRRIIEDDEDEE
jgi:hypothetical protein